MASDKFKVSYHKAKGPKEAFTLVKKQLTPSYLEKMNVKADIKEHAKENKLVAKGKGFQLTLNFEETYCSVDLDISFLLIALKGKITTGIQKELEQTI